MTAPGPLIRCPNCNAMMNEGDDDSEIDSDLDDDDWSDVDDDDTD